MDDKQDNLWHQGLAWMTGRSPKGKGPRLADAVTRAKAVADAQRPLWVYEACCLKNLGADAKGAAQEKGFGGSDAVAWADGEVLMLTRHVGNFVAKRQARPYLINPKDDCAPSATGAPVGRLDGPCGAALGKGNATGSLRCPDGCFDNGISRASDGLGRYVFLADVASPARLRGLPQQGGAAVRLVGLHFMGAWPTKRRPAPALPGGEHLARPPKSGLAPSALQSEALRRSLDRAVQRGEPVATFGSLS